MTRTRRSRLSRIGVAAASLLVIGGLGLVNWRAYHPGGLETAVAQVRYLGRELDHGGAERMQELFPEGYVFTWALYGLAAAQIAGALPGSDLRRDEMLRAASDAVARVGSDAAKSTFVRGMTPEYGAFYASWHLYLRSVLLRALRPGEAAPFDLAGFERDCALFAAALEGSESPFLPSYPAAAWPADTGVGVAALAIRDQVRDPLYGSVTGRWMAALRTRLDPSLGAVTHADGFLDGGPEDGPRGESLALLSLVLADVDPAFARQQYTILREHFIDYAWGVPGVREYPHGIDGPGDVDSGPIVFGFSGPALVVGAGAATVHGDEEVASALLAVAEVVGVPIQFHGRRRYAGGLVPVGDAFLAWVRTLRAPPTSGDFTYEPIIPRHWRLPLHCLSLLIAVVVVYRAARLVRS